MSINTMTLDMIGVPRMRPYTVKKLQHSKFLGASISQSLCINLMENYRRKISITCTLLLNRCYGAFAVQGTGRPTMEDTYSVAVDSGGSGASFFGVFDGHGGTAVAEMLKTSLWPIYKNKLSEPDLIKATTAAYLEADQLALAQPKGLFGALRERGLGGSQCGATAATVVLQPVQANVGDARVVLSRGGQAIQLTFDHKPDVEEERKRIEAKNPFPKKPLVVNIEGTWRVGGLLALSRAFGDAYLKNWSDGRVDGAEGGYGLIAEPDVTVETITSDDDFVVLATDGLWEKIENQEVIDICLSTGLKKSLEDVAKELVKVAQNRGTTDDISVIVVRLSKATKIEPTEKY
uniref:protein-serine/threonine phosphatase n=1 Tax=Araucaria cunninghamii TaxID=56994 RepID=A0A0D6R9I8_ARACU